MGLHRDPVGLGSGQVLLVLGVVGQQLGQQHGLHCADGVAQGAQEFKFEIVKERLHAHVQIPVRPPDERYMSRYSKCSICMHACMHASSHRCVSILPSGCDPLYVRQKVVMRIQSILVYKIHLLL